MLPRLLGAILGLSVATSALAQNRINDYYVDFAVPDTPALSLFGLSPSKIARPGNLKELAIAVLPLATADARIGSGVAASWAPVYTFADSVSSYRSGIARHLAFSAATTKDSASDAINLGAGLRVMLVDRSDPVLDAAFNADVLDILTKSLRGPERRNDFWNTQASPVLNDIVSLMTSDTLKQAELKLVLLDSWNIMSVPPGTTADSQILRFQRAVNREASAAEGIPAVDLGANAQLRTRVEALAKAYAEAEVPPPATSKARLTARRQKFVQEHWQALVLSLDVGELFRSPSGTWGDLQARQFGSSFLAALPAGRSGQLVVQVQGRKGLGERPDEDWFYSGGGRALVGSATKRLSVEGLFSKARALDAARNGVTKRVTIGTEVRISQGFWLEIALGGEWAPSKDQKRASLLSLAALKYAFKAKPRFTEVPGVSEEEP